MSILTLILDYSYQEMHQFSVGKVSFHLKWNFPNFSIFLLVPRVHCAVPSWAWKWISLLLKLSKLGSKSKAWDLNIFEGSEQSSWLDLAWICAYFNLNSWHFLTCFIHICVWNVSKTMQRIKHMTNFLIYSGLKSVIFHNFLFHFGFLHVQLETS